LEDYKKKQLASRNLVEIDGKMVRRDRVCHRPVVKVHAVPGLDGNSVDKTIVATSKRGYLVDEKTGAHLRIGGKPNGKDLRKARKAARDLETACKL
jgi:hypothetical protein